MSRSTVVRLALTIAATCAAAVALPHARQLASRPPEAQIRSLEAPGRVAAQKVEEILARLDLRPGLIVADIGAGTGVFSRPLARAVGPAGKVYAVDIVPELLAYLDGRARQEQLANIQSVLGVADDPKLPARDVDIALFNDVLHHIEHRQLYLKTLATSMKPDSLMAIVEFDNRGDRTRLIEGVPMIDRVELDSWLAELGFRAAQEYTDLFPNKWYVIYARGEAGERLRRAPPAAPLAGSNAPAAGVRQPLLQDDPRLASGTGSIDGTVIDGVTHLPVADASVSLTLTGTRSRRAMRTGADGTFVFDGVPAGDFSVLASKSGYSSFYEDPDQVRALRAPSSFELADGEDARGMTIPLWKSGTVQGRVIDDNGAPLARVPIELLRVSKRAGRTYMTRTAGRTSSDANGGYLLSNVLAGQYVVVAPTPLSLVNAMRTSPTGGEQATIFHPGVLSADDATIVTVAPGSELTVADMRRPNVPTVSVAGRVHGLPSGARDVVAELLREERDGVITGLPLNGTVIQPDGAFRIQGVPQGTYTIRVRHFPRPAGRAAAMQSSSVGGGGSFSGVGTSGEPLLPMSDAPTLWASVPIAVGQVNIEDLDLTLSVGARIRGTVTFQGTRSQPSAAELNATSILLITEPDRDLPMLQMARLESDGTFTTTGLPPGRYALAIAPVFSADSSITNWSPESLTVNGRKASNLEVTSTDVTDVRLTYTDSPAKLSGVVRDAGGSLVPGAAVHIFPTNGAAWTPGFSSGPRTLRTSRNGAFETSVPSGEYFVAAALRAEPSPDLDALARRATRVRVQIGERPVIDLVAP